MRPPKLFVPRPTTETSGPPSPRKRVRMRSTLTDGGRPERHPRLRLLAAHPEMSGFSGTGVPADEGQHLQSVYPAAKKYGGPGRFGFAAESHLTESDVRGWEQTAEALFDE